MKKKIKAGSIQLSAPSAYPWNLPVMGKEVTQLSPNDDGLMKSLPPRKQADFYLHVTRCDNMRQAIPLHTVIDWRECDDGNHLMIVLENVSFDDDGNSLGAKPVVVVSKPSYDELAEIMSAYKIAQQRGY
jgi:hypothetical protein